MFKKKIKKLLSDLTLSITYARLLEEIDDTKVKNQNIIDGKFQLFQNKRVEKNDSYIEEVNKAIDSIKANYSTSEYMIYVDNKFDEKLELLSKQKNYRALKYDLAIAVILDNTVDYKNTEDFLEELSFKLFNNKATIKMIRSKLVNIYNYLIEQNNTNVGDKLIDGAITALPFMKYLKTPAKAVLLGATRHPFVAASAIAVGFGIAGYNNYLGRIRASKTLVSLSSNDLEYQLISKALCFTVATDYMSDIEYKRYFQNEMKLINSIKKKVDKELFTKWINVEENKKKASMLAKFDGYILKEVKIIENK